MYFRYLRNFILSFIISIIFVGTSHAKDISVNFIANATVRITDGEYVLFTDFPYVPGAYGHMEYTYPYFVEQDNKVTTLITNRMADHFDPDVFMTLSDWQIIAPNEVTTEIRARYVEQVEARDKVVEILERDHKVNVAINWDSDTEIILTLPDPINKPKIITLSDEISHGPMAITMLKTKAAQTEHYSYLLQWAGRKIYFSGDTGDTDHLLKLPKVDIAFLSPWLYENAKRADALPSGAKIIIYQHKDNEIIPRCTGCIIPQKGEFISFD